MKDDDKITIAWLPADAAEPAQTSTGLLTEYEKAMRARDSDQVTDTEREALQRTCYSKRKARMCWQQQETCKSGNVLDCA